MHPGAVLTSLASLAAAAGVWCWMRYEGWLLERSGLRVTAEDRAREAAAQRDSAAALEKLQQENTELRRQLADALEAAKPPPSPGEVAAKVLAVRELAFSRVPVWTPAPADDIMARLSAGAAAAVPPEAAAARMRACLAMGFVADAFDYSAAMAGVAAMKPGGFYDAASGRLYYQSEATLDRADSRQTFAGALLPVLLAQNFADASPPPEPDNDDDALAAQCLFSGDANFARVQYSIGDRLRSNYDRGQGPAVVPPSANAPQFFQETWKWSEDAGNLFVQALHAKGGHHAVNQAYLRPPRSTAEILHPEKLYLASPPFAPVRVAFPDMTVNGAAPLLHNVAGEWGVWFLLRIYADVDTASAASDGWAGDRYAVWPGSQEYGDHVLWRSVWMTGEDAQEFFEAQRRILMQRHLIPWQKEYDTAAGRFHVDDPHRVIRLARTERTVTLLNATDPAFAKAAEGKFFQ
jgi:hypothetical protein